MDTDSTAAVDRQDRDPLLPAEPTSLSIDMAALRRMNMRELHDFRTAIHTIGNVICGLICQPRFFKGEHTHNTAGLLIEGVLDLINGFEQAAVNVAVAAKPSAPEEVEYRGWAIIGFAADMTDSLAEVGVLAAEAIRDEAAAKFHERHARAA